MAETKDWIEKAKEAILDLNSNTDEDEVQFYEQRLYDIILSHAPQEPTKIGIDMEALARKTAHNIWNQTATCTSEELECWESIILSALESVVVEKNEALEKIVYKAKHL